MAEWRDRASRTSSQAPTSDLYRPIRPVPVARRHRVISGRNLLVLAAVLVLAVATGSGITFLRATPPTPAKTSASVQTAVRHTLTRYFTTFQQALATSNCAALAEVSTAPLLIEEQRACRIDRGERAHKEIQDWAPTRFLQVAVAGKRAVALVRKHQSILFIHDQCGVADDLDPCGFTGEPHTQRNLTYTMQYDLRVRHGAWLVMRAVRIGG